MTQAPAQTDPQSQASPDAPEATTPATTQAQHTMKPTRTSMVWPKVGIGAALLLATLVFIQQNGLGMGLMFALLLGALLVLTVGAARVLQLRRVARRHRRADQLS